MYYFKRETSQKVWISLKVEYLKVVREIENLPSMLDEYSYSSAITYFLLDDVWSL